MTVAEWEKVEDLYFESDSSIIKRVGRESISNPIVAIVELIKNSYDADSENVEIIFENIRQGKGRIRIVDDGLGMTPEQLSKKWMILATDDKEKNPLTEEKKRVKIGEKGIGRIGIEGLSNKLEIISKPKNHEKMFRLDIEWDKYEPGILLNKIPNKLSQAPKKKSERGFEVVLSDLTDKWDEEIIKQLKEQISLITPMDIDLSFSVDIKCVDYPEYGGKVESSFLKRHIFYFKAQLDEKGNAIYFMKQRKGGYQKFPEKNLRFSCGPINLEFYFFYRDSQKFPDEVDISHIRKVLDTYGGIKLYRDNFLVKLQRNDWLGLNQIRVNDPSWCPGTDQLFGFVKITKFENPLIKDTTNREGLIENDAYKDMVSFLRRAFDYFKVFRKQAEQHKGRKKDEGEEKKEVEKKIRKIKVPEKIESFIDFSKQYPDFFYGKLEDEINQCYKSKLPNATLILCRKMIENLVYNILDFKFPTRLELRFDTNHNRPHNLSFLMDNLKEKKDEFDAEQKVLLSKSISMLKPFFRHANSKAHNIMEYINDISELDKLKITEIIQVLLKLISNINRKNIRNDKVLTG